MRMGGASSNNRMRLKLMVIARPFWLDIALLGMLAGLSPLIFGVRLPVHLIPDSIAYLSLAKTFQDMEGLFLRGWGHVDAVLVLPPLYPALIAVMNFIGNDAISNALLLNSALMLMATVALYVLIRRFASALIAASALALIWINTYVLLISWSIVTEPAYILLTAVGLLLTMRVSHTPTLRWTPLVALGSIGALAFYTRFVGVVFCALLVFWMVTEAVRRRWVNGRWEPKGPLIVFVSCASLMAPFLFYYQQQSGTWELQQSFRENRYSVSESDPTVLNRIERLERAGATNYLTIYRNRRSLRELLPDGSEMLAYVVKDIPKADDGNPAAGSRSATVAPERVLWNFFSNLFANLAGFAGLFGTVTLCISVLSCFTPLFVRPIAAPWWPRMLLPATIASYTVAVSLATGTIERYMVVVFPFAIAQIAIELGVFHQWWARRGARPIIASVITALILAGVFHSMPRTVFNDSNSHSISADIEHRPLLNGEPTFALLPVYPYLGEGKFRVLPNDSLERTVQYGRLTGVRWLLVPEDPQQDSEVLFYNKAEWLLKPAILKERSDLLQLIREVKLGGQNLLLFEIRK
jgi:hypothetical protein